MKTTLNGEGREGKGKLKNSKKCKKRENNPRILSKIVGAVQVVSWS